MKLSYCYRIKVVFVVFVAVVVLGSGSAKADFTFGEPVNLGPPINTGTATTPNISADDLTLYFSSNRSGGLGWMDIWVSTRDSKEDDWGEPVNLGTPINDSWGWEADPSISSDGLELYFRSDKDYSNDPDNAVAEIWVVKKDSVNDPWGEPTKLGPIVNDSSYSNWTPCISTDGLDLYFSSKGRYDPNDNRDIWVTHRATKDDPWQEPVHLGPEINSSAGEFSPSISSDGLVIFFVGWGWSDGFGGPDIYMSKRATVSDPWQQAVNLGAIINTGKNEFAPSISSDGSTLYFESPGGIWQTSVIPICDFNNDGNIDTGDLLIMIDNWGMDNSLCDIGPMPWGNGLVDIEDLTVFMKYWEQENIPENLEDVE